MRASRRFKHDDPAPGYRCFKGGPLVAAMLAFFIAFASPASAAKPDCGKNPLGALPALVKRALKHGGEQVTKGLDSQVVGWEAPTKELLFPEDGGSASLFSVVVKPGKRPGELTPVSLIFLRSLISSEKRQDRTVLAADLAGRLQSAIFASNGVNNDSASPSTKEKLGPDDARAQQALAERLAWACGIVSRGKLSYQEEIAARAKKLGIKPAK